MAACATVSGCCLCARLSGFLTLSLSLSARHEPGHAPHSTIARSPARALRSDSVPSLTLSCASRTPRCLVSRVGADTESTAPRNLLGESSVAHTNLLCESSVALLTNRTSLDALVSTLTHHACCARGVRSATDSASCNSSCDPSCCCSELWPWWEQRLCTPKARPLRCHCVRARSTPHIRALSSNQHYISFPLLYPLVRMHLGNKMLSGWMPHVFLPISPLALRRSRDR